MWLVIIASIIALFTYFKIIKPLKYWKEKGVLHLKPWPLVGNMARNLFRKMSMMDLLEDLYKYFPEERYFGMYSFMRPLLVIRDPNLIKRITVKEFDTFPEHLTFVPEDADPLWSKNLFSITGQEKWHDMRSTLSPSFTSSKLRTMFGLMSECATQFVTHFEKKSGLVTVEMKDVFSRFTNDVIATTAFGVTCNSLEDQTNEFYEMGKNAISVGGKNGVKILLYVLVPAIARLLKLGVFSKEVDAFFRRLIKETLKVREEKGIIRPDMINLLMEARRGRLNDQDQDQSNVIDTGFAVVQEAEAGSKGRKKPKAEITDEDITAQALIFFLAGFDTASTAMSFAAYELALNTDVQEMLLKEIDTVLESINDSSVTYESLLGMKYMDQVVSETLRKWPPAIFTDRISVKPFTLNPEKPGEKSLHLETGTVCWIPIHAMQRDSKYYSNPEKFDPERFNDENKHTIAPFTYLPFGAGPRNCIGSRFALLEVKLILFKILSKFEIVPIEKTQIPLTMVKGGFQLLPEEGFWLGLKPRQNN